MIMLSSTSYLLLTLLISSTLADLTCLQWAFVSPLVSAICYFSPKTASKVEAAAIEGIKTAIDDAKELIEFDLKHMPITVAYNYATIAHNAGWSSANEYAKNTTADYGEVSIGFGKESVNQAYSLFNLLEWNDYTYCIIKGAVKNAKGGSNKRSRGLVKKRAISDIDAAGIAKRCLSDKFSKGPVFNVSAGNEQVGATISDIAALFIPVAPEGAVVGNIGTFDIALAGAEDTTRIFKQGEAGLARAEHFSSKTEAQKVAKALQEEGWGAKNCGTCGVAGVVGVAGTVIGTSRRLMLKSRGAGFSLCCKPQALEDVQLSVFDHAAQQVNEFDTATSDASSVVNNPADLPEEFFGDVVEEDGGLQTYDPTDYNIVAESELVAPRDFEIRDVFGEGSDTVYEALANDIKTTDTGLVPFSPKLKSLKNSKDLFAELRKVFTGSVDDPLYQILGVRQRDDLGRMTVASAKWPKTGGEDAIPELLKPWREFADQAVADAQEITRKVRPGFEDSVLGGAVEFFWVPPGKQGIVGADPRGFHVDGSFLNFGVSDTPGLVLKNSLDGTASRVKVVDDGLHLIKGEYFGIVGDYVPGTEHAVYGPEMAQNGRVSMIVGVTPRPYG